MIRETPVIAVTRAAAQAAELVTAIDANGGVARVLPLVVVAPPEPEDARAFAEAIADLAHFDALVFTSVNAVAAFASATTDAMRRACYGKLVACVGPRTALEAGKARLVVGAVPMTSDARALARELRPRVRGKRVLVPQADRADGSLAKALRDAGAEVVAAVAYRTLAAPRAEIEAFERAVVGGEIDAATFAAGSAVAALVEALGMERARLCCDRVAVAVLGGSAVGRLEAFGRAPDAVAKTTTMESLARAALDAVALRRRERS